MCGIVGTARGLTQIAFIKQRFPGVIDMLSHRGPDGQGACFVEDSKNDLFLAMGHTRLAIFDTSDAGKQPFFDNKGRRVVFNGEILNWLELRRELESVGYSFRSACDTEILLSAYDYWGQDCLTKFVGFWSFALFDPDYEDKGPALLLVRDRVGIKPLYYKCSRGAISFASEISPLFSIDGDEPELDPEWLGRQILYGLSDDSDKTIYRGISELEPGKYLVFSFRDKSSTVKPYWTPILETVNYRSESEVIDRFEEIVEKSASQWLRSDRELALTLSGGVDSSVVALAASRSGVKELKAYTSHFPKNPEIDETEYASYVANLCGIDQELVETEDFSLEDSDNLCLHQELLHVSYSQLVNWMVLKKVRSHGTVVTVSGQGGDELFLGYERYLVMQLLSELKRPASFMKSLVASGRNSRLGVTQMMAFLLYFSTTHIRQIRYKRDALSAFKKEFVDNAAGRPAKIHVDLKALQLQELAGQQLRRLLRYDDRTSSALGMESRPMLLDHRIVEFALSLPIEYKIKDGWTKYILRRYLSRHGLEKVAWRTHKLGYNAPTNQWCDLLFNQKGKCLIDTSFARSVLKDTFKYESASNRMKFPVLNMLSTASLMDWKPINY